VRRPDDVEQVGEQVGADRDVGAPHASTERSAWVLLILGLLMNAYYCSKPACRRFFQSRYARQEARTVGFADGVHRGPSCPNWRGFRYWWRPAPFAHLRKERRAQGFPTLTASWCWWLRASC